MNQAAQVLGNKVEMEMTKSIEKNKTLLKVQYLTTSDQLPWSFHFNAGKANNTFYLQEGVSGEASSTHKNAVLRQLR